MTRRLPHSHRAHPGFEFNQSCQKIKVSKDGNYIMTSGESLHPKLTL